MPVSRDQAEVRHWDVVIVGAGPVGLALAIELGGRGVRCLLVERNERVGRAPRAKTTNVRTRGLLRRWGIADRLADMSPLGVDYPSDVYFVTRLSGPLLARIPNAFNMAPEQNSLYPEHAQWVPQYTLEQVLRERVNELSSVEVRLSTEFVGAEQTGERVRIRLRGVDDTTEDVVDAAYLVGADGARSSVREVIGARMSGTYGLSQNYNIVFRAPGLARAHAHGPGIMYWQINAQLPGLIGPMDRDDVWFFMPTGIPEGKQLSDEEARALIVEATGLDLEYEILSSDLWTASRLIADRYRRERIFLAGDACHLHPPFGGYGMNMGVADAVDLGWKLAAVLQGWGGPALLDSYETERRPVHDYVMDEAEANHAVLGNQLWAPGLEDDDARGAALREKIGKKILQYKVREFYTLGAVLGLCYEHSPVIEPVAEAPARDSRHYTPSSIPGCLAPHMWIDGETSLYDRFGPGFTLLVHQGASDVDAALAEARRTGIPLKVVELPAAAASTKLYPHALTLIRPDQFVCWREDAWRQGALAAAAGLTHRVAREQPRNHVRSM